MPREGKAVITVPVEVSALAKQVTEMAERLNRKDRPFWWRKTAQWEVVKEGLELLAADYAKKLAAAAAKTARAEARKAKRATSSK